MDKIIITNNTDLPMTALLLGVHELVIRKAKADSLYTYGEGKEHYCYIKKNKDSFNYIFGENRGNRDEKD